MTGTIFIIFITATAGLAHSLTHSLYLYLSFRGEAKTCFFPTLCLRPQFHSAGVPEPLQVVLRWTDGRTMSFLMMSYGDGLNTTGAVIDGHLAPPALSLSLCALVEVVPAGPLASQFPEKRTNSSVFIREWIFVYSHDFVSTVPKLKISLSLATAINLGT